MSGNAPLATQLVTLMSVAAMMVVAGLGKRRLERRPEPREPRQLRFRRKR